LFNFEFLSKPFSLYREAESYISPGMQASMHALRYPI